MNKRALVNKRKILEKLLRFMARAVLKKYRPKIIGITGSVGKSSAKEAVAVTLATGYSVRKSEGNYNNEIGLPLTIIGAQSGGSSVVRWLGVGLKWLWLMMAPARYPEILVLEMGIDRPGDMEYLLEFIPVEIGIATHISASHLLYFGSLTNIAKEKGKLIASLPESGFAILNADDPKTLKMRERTRAKVITYGFDPGADLRVDNLNFERDPRKMEGFRFKVNYQGTTIPVRLPKIIAAHHIPAALSAIAVGITLKMNLVDIGKRLEQFEPLPGRMHLLSGKDGTHLIDDAYNASPASTRAALQVMKEFVAPRKMAILGDMLELGPACLEEHEGLAEAIEEAGVTFVMTVGKHMRSLHEALLARGYSRKQLMWFPEPLTVAEVVQSTLHPGDLILIKGSQGMRMELVVAELLADPKSATRVLCRQSPSWKSRPFAPPEEWAHEERAA